MAGLSVGPGKGALGVGGGGGILATTALGGTVQPPAVVDVGAFSGVPTNITAPGAIGGITINITTVDPAVTARDYTLSPPGGPENNPVTFTGTTASVAAVPSTVAGDYVLRLYETKGGVRTRESLATITVQAAQAAPVAGSVVTQLLSSVSMAGVVGYRSEGLTLAKGDIPFGMMPVIVTPAGTTLVTQVDQINRWSDGSIRQCTVSFQDPASVAAGTQPTYNVALSSSAPPAANPVTPAQLAAASDWLATVTGMDFGTDVFTVHVNDVLANLAKFDAVNGWGTNPPGGWTLIRPGPICTFYKAWRYLKRESDGANHSWVKVVIYLAIYSNGSGAYEYEIVAQPTQSNSYGPHALGSVGPTTAAQQSPYGGFWQVKNGATLKATYGGPSDPGVFTFAAANIGIYYGQVQGTDSNLLRNRGFRPTGPALAQPVTRTVYATADGGSNVQLFFNQGDAYGNGIYPGTWAAGTVNQYDRVVSNGAVWVSFSPTTTASTAPVPTNPQGGKFIGADGIQWVQLSVAYKTTLAAGDYVNLEPVPYTNPGNAQTLVHADTEFLHDGATGRAGMIFGLSALYLSHKTRVLPPYDFSTPFQMDDPTFDTPYGYSQPSVFLYSKAGSWNDYGDLADDERVGYLSQSNAKAVGTPLDPITRRTTRRLAFSHSSFYIHWDDERSGMPVNPGIKAYPGMPTNSSLLFNLNQQGRGNPAWGGLGTNGQGLSPGGYGPLVDASHMPSLWALPAMRSGHPLFFDQGRSITSVLFASSDPNNRSITDSAGKSYNFSFMQHYMLVSGVRWLAWVFRQNSLLDLTLADNDPYRPFMRDTMDENAHYATIFESEEGGGHIAGIPGGLTGAQGYLNLGITYNTDGDTIQDTVNHEPNTHCTWHQFMAGHLFSATNMLVWNGERAGWRVFSDLQARYHVAGFAGNFGFYLHDYALAFQDAKGQPVYPDWNTAWQKSGYQYPPPATDMDQNPDFHAGDGSICGISDTGPQMLAGLVLRVATCPDDTAAANVLQTIHTRITTSPFSGQAATGKYFANGSINPKPPYNGLVRTLPAFFFTPTP